MRRLDEKTRVDKKYDELLPSQTSASYVPINTQSRPGTMLEERVNDVSIAYVAT